MKKVECMKGAPRTRLAASPTATALKMEVVVVGTVEDDHGRLYAVAIWPQELGMVPCNFVEGFDQSRLHPLEPTTSPSGPVGCLLCTREIVSYFVWIDA